MKLDPELIKTLLIAGVGGAAHYIHDVYKGKKFSFTQFVFRIGIAGFIGFVVGDFLDPTMAAHDAVIAMSGVASLPIMDFLYEQGQRFAEVFIQKK